MTDLFWQIWNQLVLISQVEIYGNIADIFKSIEKQILEGKEHQKLTDRQYITLINAAREWRDILAKQSAKENDCAERESNSESSDS